MTQNREQRAEGIYSLICQISMICSGSKTEDEPMVGGIVLAIATCEFYNQVYKQLVLQRHSPILDQIRELAGSHSLVCFLLVLHEIQKMIHSNVPRGITPFQLFSKLYSNRRPIVTNIVALFAHQCHGADITNQDPNVPLFYYKVSK